MRHYIGIDFHLQHSSVAVMDESGKVVEEKKLYHRNREEFEEYFSSFEIGTRVAVEATRNWYWLADFLQDKKLDVKLVNPKKVRVIAESTIKTDKIDAKVLANLNRCNYLPESYIADKKTRSARELLRYYMSLVRIRASIKNRIHSILAKNNISYGFTDIFGKAGMVFLEEVELPEMYRYELEGYLKLIKNLSEGIKDAKDEIIKRAKESDYTKKLITVPGIAYFTGLLIASEIGDINRFSTYKKLCCYAGLASSVHQSAEKTYHGHMIKDSNKYIRYALIEIAPIAIKKDDKLWTVYMKLKEKKGRNKAIVAIARKLLVSIYFMLKEGTNYRMEKALR